MKINKYIGILLGIQMCIRDRALTVLLKDSKYSYQIVGELILIGIKKSQTARDVYKRQVRDR